MTLFAFFLLLIVSAWLLTGAILLFHRNSIAMGLFPLTAFVGGLTAMMQLHILGYFQPEIWGRTITMLVGNYLFFPIILISLLIVYVTNGGIQARVIFDGINFVMFLIVLIGFAKLFFPYAEELPGFVVIEITPRFLLAQILSAILGISAMLVFYQTISNIRSRFPSRFAGGMALLIAVWAETLIFQLINNWGSPYWWQDFGIHLAAKSMLALSLWPLLIPYLLRVAPKLPNSVATLRRPVLDFFMTFEQLESRAQYSHSLLRTLSQINQLIVHSTDAEHLLQQACDALVELRKYHMVWIGAIDEQSGELNFATQAGFSSAPIAEHINGSDFGNLHAQGSISQTIVVTDIANQKKYSAVWQQMMLETGCQAAASFPMNYADRVLGVLYICMNQPNSLEEIEIELLQKLADDLAYALVSLEARKQQAILHAATETMQDGLLIADLHGVILYANTIISQIVGVEPELMLGKNIDDLFSSDQLEILTDTFRKLYQEKVLIFDLPYQSLDGRVTDISVNAAIVEDQNGDPIQLVANIRNTSHLREYERQLLTLNHLTGELVQIHDTQILMKRILEMGEELLGANASGIYFVNPKSSKITDSLTNNLDLEYSNRITQDYRGLPGETAGKSLQPVFVKDTSNDSVYGDRIHFMAEYKIRALLILPIVFQNQPIGALTVYYPEPREFAESQLQLGLILAQTLAIVIQNANLYRAEQEQRQLAEALIQAAASLNTSLDLDFVLDQILEQVMRVIPCKAANILMIKGDNAYVQRHRGYSPFPKLLDKIDSLRLPLSTPNIQQMLTEDRAIIIPDTTADLNWDILPGADWIKGYAAVPLKVEGQIVGFLNIDSDRPNFFTIETLQHLEIFSDHAATAIKNARLYNAEYQQRELAEALAQGAASVSSSLELTDVLDRILQQTMRVVPCQAANIMLIVGEKVILTRHRGYGNFISDISTLDSMEFPLNWPGLKEMYREEKPIFMTDTNADNRWQHTSNANWVQSFIGIPLKINQQVVGFLNLDSDKPGLLNKDFLPPLQTFANYASTAIKNARLYESSHQRAEEMAALVAAASAVSKNLDYMQVLQVVAKQMIKTLKIQACMIASYDLKTNTVSKIIEYSPKDWFSPSKWETLEPLEDFPATYKVITDNIPFQLHADDPNLTSIQQQFFNETQTKTVLILPLTTKERTIGLVNLMDTESSRIFSAREIALGLSLAAHAATALENALLYQQLQDYASELEGRVQKRTHELQEATEYIEGILASVPDAIFVLDQETYLVRANQAGEHLLAQAQLTGVDLFNRKLLQILKNGEGLNFQSTLEVQERAYQALSSQLITDDGLPSGQIIVFRDVTHFRELDQMKNHFVSDVSHELRTPLTNLTLYLGLLNTTRDQNKQDDYIQTLQRETERLTHLIEDLLTISRLEASRIQFQIRPTSLNQLVEELVCDRTILAAQKSIELDFTPADDLPLASADTNMLTQALSNLLTNATNYTQPGGNVHIYTAQPEPDWIIIQISDTGVGIPSDEAEHIFDRFYRGSANQHTGAEGTGLGLSISKEIIQRLGGKITIKTSPGEGSTFTIWLKPALDEITSPLA